jgi:hypothetical protein
MTSAVRASAKATDAAVDENTFTPENAVSLAQLIGSEGAIPGPPGTGLRRK